MKKKLFRILLTIGLIFVLLPATVLATETTSLPTELATRATDKQVVVTLPFSVTTTQKGTAPIENTVFQLELCKEDGTELDAANTSCSITATAQVTQAGTATGEIRIQGTGEKVFDLCVQDGFFVRQKKTNTDWTYSDEVYYVRIHDPAVAADAQTETATDLTSQITWAILKAGWNNNSSEYSPLEGDADAPPTEITFTNHYNKNLPTYAITVETDGNGTASSDVSATEAGKTVTLTATPASGYKFKEWQVVAGTVTIQDGKFTMPAETVKLKAIFEEKDEEEINKPSMDDLNKKDHTAYIYGYPDGSVRPDDNLTRAETAAMLYRLLTSERQAELATTDCKFTDVSTKNWYYDVVASMTRGGYIMGYPDGTYRGDLEITRAEFIAMLVRFVDKENLTSCFPDVKTSHWAYQEIATAKSLGWVNGYEDGTFRPEEYITRAEAIRVMNCMLERGVNESSTLLDFKNATDNKSGAWYYYEIIEALNGHDYTGTRPGETWVALH